MKRLLGVPIVALILAWCQSTRHKPDGAVRHVTDVVPVAATRAAMPP